MRASLWGRVMSGENTTTKHKTLLSHLCFVEDGLILLLKVSVNPQKFLLLVQHFAQIAKPRILFLQPCLKLPQHSSLGPDDTSAFRLRSVLFSKPFRCLRS